MAELLVKLNLAPDLGSFVRRLEDQLGCCGWEEHESSNYPPENRYFRCVAIGVEIVAAVNDDSEFPQYDIQLCFATELWQPDQEFLTGLADCVARKLVLNGYEVLRPLDSLHAGKGGLRYSFDPTAGKMPWDQVITQKI
jgi:hypothetical protein